ncbi:hypothetical protein KW787_00835 [Candidatus Pacearchaeota archaeon]|nr:hypothetical protein [Candidatus Pacearchaeota archaeon]
MNSFDQLQDIVRALKRIKKEEKLRVEDSIVLDSAVRIYNSTTINKSSKREPRDMNAPITEKQIKLLKDLNYEGNMNLTKLQATQLIQRYFENRKAKSQ